jgi:hypothetical protein
LTAIPAHEKLEQVIPVEACRVLNQIVKIIK